MSSLIRNSNQTKQGIDFTGNKSVVLYVTHSFKNDNKDIPLSECNVDSVYINKEWKILNKTISLSDTLSVLGKKWNINKLKK